MSNSALFWRAPACSIAAPNQGVSGEVAHTAPDILGMLVNLQAAAGSGYDDSAPYRAIKCAADKENWNAFRIHEGLSLFLAPFWRDTGNGIWRGATVPRTARLAFRSADFIQVNEGGKPAVVAARWSGLDVRAEDRVLDLFCGMGNFTLPLATRARQAW